MCLIIIKPKGVKFNNKIKDYVLESSKINCDGFGISYTEKSSYITSKKYLNFEEFKEFLNSKKFDKHQTVMIHLRMRTHGEKIMQNVHPFVISGDNLKTEQSFCNLQKANSVSMKAPVMMHNGVISKFSQGGGVNSDTFMFARDFLNKKAINQNISVLEVLFKIKNNKSYDNKILLDKFKKYDIFKNNRLAFLHPTNDLLVIGEWYKDSHGILLSNQSVGTKLKLLDS